MSRLLIVLAACGSGVASQPDAPVVVHDGSPDAAVDAVVAVDASGDGTPMRMPCTSQFGKALPSAGTFGRLDGYLVAVVDPGTTSGCNADDSHVHLQISMSGAIYDIAIDVTDGTTHMDDVHTGTLDIAMPGEPWAEGFHTGESVDYPTLGVHAADLPLLTKAQMIAAIDGDLATANHVSIFATTYGGDGAHLVHRNGGKHDGLLVTVPLAATPHLRLFSFSDQTF